ncbi:MAG: phosphoglucosamine mutase [Candidatus Dadabacteria bacterium]|nr:MAG: phosphoglucosamine mutase [Candidatus Dadabacteria bacterium]
MEAKTLPFKAKERKFFGTDGIRGVAGEPPLEPEWLVRLGKSLAAVFVKDKSRRHSILIGKDTRLSGYMIETALASGITYMGANVLLVGPIPTAGAAYLTKSMRADAGIMISASHNPFQDNGVKIFGADGFKLPDELELQIEKLCLEGDFKALKKEKVVSGKNIGKAKRIDDGIGRYTVYLKEAFPRNLTLEGLKIGLDCAHGAAYVVAPQTFEELGASVTARGVNPNGTNINAGFGSLYPKIMCELVSEQNLNLGVSFDGDSDRAILVDEKGKVVDGDMILAIAAKYLKEKGELKGGGVVGTAMSNLGLEVYLESLGLKLYRAAVGDRYVLEKMLQLGCNLGGEQSGHIIFLDYSTTGDGILTALKVCEIMLTTEKTLSELTKGFHHFPQKVINVAVRKKPALEEIAPVQKAISSVENKLGKKKGRVLVRYSGTEDKARVMVECEEQKLCDEYAQEIAEAIEKEIGKV